MKKQSKRLLAVLLSVLLLLGTVATSLSAAAEEPEIIAEGYCGANDMSAVDYSSDTYDTNAYWKLDNAGTLTISGEGEVFGRVSAMGDAPWTLFNYGHVQGVQIQYVLIEPGITNVPEAMCLNNHGLSRVEIPETVTQIGECAFYAGYSLLSIDIPDSVTVIGASAFQSCTGLTYVKLPAHLTRISQNLFLECKSLRSVTMSKSVSVIENGAFNDADNLRDIYYNGSEEDWNAISIQSNNDELLAATIHFNSEGPETEPSQPDDPYNWQPIPTSPEGLSEGDWYLDFTDYQRVMDRMLSIAPPSAEDTWYFDESAMVLKAVGVIPEGVYYNDNGTWKEYPDTMVKMEPGSYLPVSAQYYVYRFLNRVGQSWTLLSSRDPSLTLKGWRIDYPALARQVIAEDDSLTEADFDAVLDFVSGGEWMADFENRLLKGCYRIPSDRTESGKEQYRFVLPSEAFFASSVTDEPAAVPEMPNLSSLSGQWNDSISWTLENGALTISGSGAMENREEHTSTASMYTKLYYSADKVQFYNTGTEYISKRPLLSEYFDDAQNAHFGVLGNDALEQEMLAGRVDPYEVNMFFMNLISAVEEVVIEEGITSIDDNVLAELYPKKLILPTSLVSATINYTAKDYGYINPTDKNIYIMNPDADIASLRIQLPVYSETFLSMPKEELLRCAEKVIQKQIELLASYEFYESVLEELYKVKTGFSGYGYSWVPPKTEAQILADWNERTGSNYTSADALIADTIAAINTLMDTSFTSLEDIFSGGGGSSYVSRTQAYEDAEAAYAELKKQELIADDPNMEIFFHEVFEVTHPTVNLGEAIPASEDDTVYKMPDWLTIHGYADSTAEAAAAASGVRFVPITAAGTCGEHLTWVLENNTLTVSGEGAMANYSDSEPAPWSDYFAAPDASITVVLKDGVTTIGEKAFPNTGLNELIVLNKDCDLSALEIRDPAVLRGYLGSSAMTYANEHDLMSVFKPLCDVDYRHTVEIIEGVDSTCKEPGHTPGLYCVECDNPFYGNETLPLENHTWGAWVTTKEATTETEGIRTRTCAVCDAKETQTIEKLTPTDNGGSDSNDDNNDKGGFFGWLQQAMKGLVAWFKKLLQFFSK